MSIRTGYKIFFLCPAIFCAGYSCTSPSGHYDRYDTFPQESRLTAETVVTDTVLFRYPFRIAVRDSIMLVLDIHHPDHFLHAFSYPEGRHIVSFGRRGDGPEEMLAAETFHFNSPDSIWALDANRRQITRWRISARERTVERVEEVKLDSALIRTLDFHESEEGFIVPDYTGVHRYHRLDRQGRLQQSFGRIPSERTSPDDFTCALAQAWRSFIDCDMQQRMLVMVAQLGEVVEIHPLDSGQPAVCYGPAGEPEFRTHEGEGIPTGIMGFSDVQIVGHSVYAVFHGRSFKEIREAYAQGQKPESGGRFVCVFDRNGKPVHRYVLDRAVYGIHVDERTRTMLATDVNSDEPLVMFRF